MYTVYISHSVRPWELAQVYVLAQETQKQGLDSFIPDRAWDPNGPLPAYVVQPLREAQVVLLFATLGGRHHEWVNAELRVASKARLVAMAEMGVQLQVLAPKDVVQFDRGADMAAVVGAVVERLRDLPLENRNKNLVTGLIVGGLVLLLLRGLQEGGEE